MPVSTYKVQKNPHHAIQHEPYWGVSDKGLYISSNDPFYKYKPQDYKLAQLEALKKVLNTRDIELMEDGTYRTYPYVLRQPEWSRHIFSVTFYKGYIYIRLRDFALYDQWPAWYFDKTRKQQN